MKTTLFSFVLTACFIVIALATDVQQKNPQVVPADETGYASLWEEVKQQEKLSLPESAGKTVDRIYRKALQEKNSAQLIKTMIHQLKYQAAKDLDLLPEKLKEIEAFMTASTDAVEQSMLQALLAQLYWQYYQSQSFTINERTAIAGDFVPEDIREWTGNLFIKKITDDVFLSVLRRDALLSAEILEYKDILNEGETSRKLYPTVYDFLLEQGVRTLRGMEYAASAFFDQSSLVDTAYFADAERFVALNIEADPYDLKLQTLRLYQLLLDVKLKDAKQREALLLTDLKRLEYVFRSAIYERKGIDYMEALNGLEKKFENDSLCVEILSEKALFYQGSGSEPILPLQDTAEKRAYKIFDISLPEEVAAQEKERLQQVYAICQRGIDRFPTYERIGLLKNRQHAITTPSLTMTIDKQVYPGRELEIKTTYRNLRQLTVELYRIGEPITAYKETWQESGLYKKASSRLVGQYVYSLRQAEPYLNVDTLFRIPTDKPGLYELVAYVNDDKTSQLANEGFSVSSLHAAARRIDDGQVEILATDYLDGKPVENVTAVFYKKLKGVYVQVASHSQSEKGLMRVPYQKEMSFYRLYTENDKASRLYRLPAYYRSSFSTGTGQETKDQAQLFADRSLYRPGQTVFFKGIVSASDATGQQTRANKSVVVVLKNANGEEVCRKQAKTNDFGSFTGEFTLPAGGLNGAYSLQIEEYGAYCPVQVEEYKRPSFRIEFDTLRSTYRFGDEVKLSGSLRTFSGIPLQETEVTYRVTRQPHWFWRYGAGRIEEIGQGTATTDEAGRFELAFTAEKSFADQHRLHVYYGYLVETSVTSASGETQTASRFVSVGDRSMQLSVANLDRVDKKKLTPVKVSASNLEGQAVKTTGSYRLFALSDDGKLSEQTEKRPEAVGSPVDSGRFSTETPLSLESLRTKPSGRYRIVLKANDDKGRETTAEQDFTLYSTDDKRPPYTTYVWLVDQRRQARPGENVEIYFGSSAKEVDVLEDVFVKGKKLKSRRFRLNNSVEKTTVPFKAEYEEGVKVVFTFVKDKQLFSETVSIDPKKEEKKLIVRTSVFRDRLLPGQHEEWTLSVRDQDSLVVDAEVLAVLYDASLDKIRPHAWTFSPGAATGYWNAPVFEAQESGNRYLSLYLSQKNVPIPSFSYDNFNWFGLHFYGRQTLLRSMAAGAMDQSTPVLEKSAIAYDGNVLQESATSAENIEETALPQQTATQEQIRRDFNETAFFYPQLRTNEAGETLLSFTVPESNTTWKLMALAHTRRLAWGQWIEEAVSQKPLMVSPHIPRFLRQGDEASLSALVSNLSEVRQQGEATLSFFDPADETPLFTVEQSTQRFDLAPGASESFTWRFDVPAGLSLAACKIVARSDDRFSDGEQHLLPVLTNKILLTETLPLSIPGKGEKTFAFDKLIDPPSTTAESYRLTLEWASNPVWYAVQALPAMETPQTDNAVSWFAAYYANSLAAHIAQKPPIRNVVESWKAQAGEKQTLASQLEKNDELKALLLQETPWTLEAANETEQKQRLSLLFDANRNRQLTRSALDKLTKLQREDGGWPWIEGMRSNVGMTQWILFGLGSLEKKKVVVADDKNLDKLRRSALSYVDYRFARAFEEKKKRMKDLSRLTLLSSYEIEYLYVRSFYPDQPVEEAAEARAFFQSVVEKHWAKDKSLYHRALMAVALQRAGKGDIARQIVRSLREHATLHPEMGLHWANNMASPLAFFFQSATAVHTFIMEAFEEVGATTEDDRNALKRWLLKQKQTQQWESVPATVGAIYALLNDQTGENWLESKGEVSLALGGNEIDLSEAEAGTGYVKKVLTGSEIVPEMGSVRITKADAGPAWGALYWQYFEESDKATKSKTALHVEKKLFVERLASTGKTLLEVGAGQAVKVGDKLVVRLTIRTDRDMEFVALKDLHGAGLEPVEQLSGLRYNKALLYYQTAKDASTCFYFDALPRGAYVLEYSLYAAREGNYSNGLATLQCLYAPEFISHSQGERIRIVGK